MVFVPLPQASSAVSHTPSGTGPEPQRSPLSPSQLALLPRHEVGPEPTVRLLGCRCPAAAAETCAGNQLVRQTAEVGETRMHPFMMSEGSVPSSTTLGLLYSNKQENNNRNVEIASVKEVLFTEEPYLSFI